VVAGRMRSKLQTSEDNAMERQNGIDHLVGEGFE
jgi:hypothetical protein